MDNPLVSIVIPVYNGVNYMREAIDSVLAQTYSNCEIIVVNDGSTDSTEDAALSYGDKIRYFAKENGGVATALNLAIKEMRGDYFSWLSHDDVYYPEKVESQINAMRECGDMTRIVWGYHSYIDENSKAIDVGGPKNYNEAMLTQSVYPLIMGFIAGCNLLIHKSHFGRAGLFKPELRYTQDYDLWFRMFLGQETVYVKKPLCKYRIHSLQGTVTEQANMKPEEADLYLRCARELPRSEMIRLFGSAYMYYRMLFFIIVSKGDRRITEAMYDMLEKEPIPPEFCLRTGEIEEYFARVSDGKAEHICIFCAGYHGIKVYCILKGYSIKADFFADNDSSKNGSEILGGTKCLSFRELTEIKDKTLVIIAVKHPEEIQKQLKDAGFPYVVTRHDLAGFLDELK